MKRIAFIGILSIPLFLSAQTMPTKYASTITSTDLTKHLSVLASDEYEGRETGKKGQRMAADYIANFYKDLGLPPMGDYGYFQNYPLVEKVWGERKFIVNQTPYEFMKDFYCFGGEIGSGYKVNTNEIVFVGYGIQEGAIDDYKDLKLKDKVIMMIKGEPINAKGISAVTKSEEKSTWTTSFTKKINLARTFKPSLIIMVDPDLEASVQKFGHYIDASSVSLPKANESNSDLQVPCIYVSTKIAQNLMNPNNKVFDEIKMKIDKKGKNKAFLLNSTVNMNIVRLKNNISASNVLGFLKGTEKPNEVVVVSAHYDHIGIIDGEVYNGADDDGSGTVCVMEIAEAFAQAAKDGQGPKRSMLFLNFSGEEKGLLGSNYFAENPVFPIDYVVADLNIDMVGRVDKEHESDKNYVYIIGSDKLSSQLHEINENANKQFGNLKLDYTYNDPKDKNRFYYRSDHYNFAKKNIPIIFYFNGVHEDYHKKTDEIEKIDFPLMEKRAQLVFYTAWELANRADRILVDKKNDFEIK